MTVSTALWLYSRAIARQRRAMYALAATPYFDVYAMQRHIDALRGLHRGYDTLLTDLAALCLTSTHALAATR